MIAEGLNVGREGKNVLSKMIKDEKSDSYFRLNHYPPRPDPDEGLLGFGEHTDPQIISILRSNNTAGLQISAQDGTWLSVPPDDHSFFILVGDCLQVLYSFLYFVHVFFFYYKLGRASQGWSLYGCLILGFYIDF